MSGPQEFMFYIHKGKKVLFTWSLKFLIIIVVNIFINIFVHIFHTDKMSLFSF